MIRSRKFSIVLLLAVSLALLLTSGCFRKPITSDKPWRKPANDQSATAPVEAAPSEAPAPAKDDPGVIEETFVVGEDQPAPQEPEEQLMESDLSPEPQAAQPAPPTPMTDETPMPGPAATEETPMEEPPAVAEETPAATAGMYIQVGAFGDVDKAERALARLKADGYKGSRIAETDDGMYRVQAGAFADLESARQAQDMLVTDYPGCFIIKD